ncbi:MAG: hypothetical protein ACUVS1_07795 [Actinomycetota bacterium]
MIEDLGPSVFQGEPFAAHVAHFEERLEIPGPGVEPAHVPVHGQRQPCCKLGISLERPSPGT